MITIATAIKIVMVSMVGTAMLPEGELKSAAESGIVGGTVGILAASAGVPAAQNAFIGFATTIAHNITQQ